MGRTELLEKLANELGGARGAAGLNAALEKIAAFLGFRYYSLGHHRRRGLHNAVRFSNYPVPFSEGFLSDSNLSEDPVICACEKVVTAFLWSDICRIVNTTEAQRLIIARASAAGLASGLTIPMHVPGEYAGSCSFADPQQRCIPIETLAFGHYLGSLAFENIRRLASSARLGLIDRGDRYGSFLSARQRECVALAAKGKTDIEAGQLLGISHETVHRHMEMAKRNYGVSTRTQLVVGALFDCQLTFQDALSP